MTGIVNSMAGTAKRIGNSILGKLQDYTLDRLVWCLVAIGLCWCEVQNYHRYIFWQQMYIMAGLGVFYCLKLGCFAKGKRVFCGIATMIGALITLYVVKTNFFNTYYYLNWPIGILATVTLNLYVLVIYDCIKERRFPFSLNPSMVFILMVIAQQFSVYNYRRFYLYILIGLLPYIMMKKGVRTRSCMLNGMIDGMCIGFFLVQGYAWMHRPYNYSAIRYTAFSNDKTNAARIYLAYYAVWIIRYAQVCHHKINIWNAICRVFTWFMAAFVLALVYLTGSRSTVLAIMLMTAIAVAVRYRRPKDKWYLRLGKCGLWLVNCVCVGVVSLALFPTAYASVRYLPAYFNEPDYIDSIGYRWLSRPIQEWGEQFGWNFEYDEFAVKKDEPEDSVRYATFEEAVHYNLGRIIPGADEYLEVILAEKLLESGKKRLDYYYETGVYSQGAYDWRVKNLINDYSSEGVKDGKTNVNSVKYDWDEDSEYVAIYRELMSKLFSVLVLRADAEALQDSVVADAALNEEVEGEATEETEIIPGDTKEMPLNYGGRFAGNGMDLRIALHEYTIKKLNLEGHKEGSYVVWLDSYGTQPHGHNIFLIFGYDFGIPTMILMVLWFVVTILVSIYNVIRYYKAEYLFLLLLGLGMIIFGWFESGFYYKTSIFAYMILATIYTDVLHVRKKEKPVEVEVINSELAVNKLKIVEENVTKEVVMEENKMALKINE